MFDPQDDYLSDEDLGGFFFSFIGAICILFELDVFCSNYVK